MSTATCDPILKEGYMPGSERVSRRKPKTRTGAKSCKRRKMRKVMREFKEGQLHSGSHNGPVVKTLGQAIAIGLSESGQSRAKKKKR